MQAIIVICVNLFSCHSPHLNQKIKAFYYYFLKRIKDLYAAAFCSLYLIFFDYVSGLFGLNKINANYKKFKLKIQSSNYVTIEEFYLFSYSLFYF